MSILFVAVHVVVCFVLIAVILLQAGRGQGFGGSFGSGEGTQTIFGTRSADFLSKATSVCAILFLFTCIGLDVMESRKGRSLFESPKLKSEDLQALQKALKELEAKEASQKKTEGVTAPSQAVPSEKKISLASETASTSSHPAVTATSEVPSKPATESSAKVEAGSTAK